MRLCFCAYNPSCVQYNLPQDCFPSITPYCCLFTLSCHAYVELYAVHLAFLIIMTIVQSSDINFKADVFLFFLFSDNLPDQKAEDTSQETGDEGKEQAKDVAKSEVKEEIKEQRPVEEAEKRVKYL